MFTGIVRGIGKIAQVEVLPGLHKLRITLGSSLLVGVELGASISIDGVCLTVVNFNEHDAHFDVIQETLEKTNLKLLNVGDSVNIERAARFGDEIGGHVLSGHIFGKATVHSIECSENNYILSLKCPLSWTQYLFPKGFIALNGASLTLVDVDKKQGIFSVHLIPETLAKTTFAKKKVGDSINVEIDTQTQTIVDTIQHYVSKSTS